MAVLIEIVKSILVIIIVVSFLELLLPDGLMKPFIRFAVGLFILVSILNPLLSTFFHDEFQISLWDYKIDPGEELNILNKGEEIQADIAGFQNEFIKEKIQGQIAAMALLVPGVEDVKSEVHYSDDGSIEQMNLYVMTREDIISENESDKEVFTYQEKSDEKNDEIEFKMKKIIEQFFGISDSEKISIEFEGG